MKYQIEIELGAKVSGSIRAGMPTIPGLRVRVGGPQPYLSVGERRWRLMVHPRRPDDGEIDKVIREIRRDAKQAGENALPLVADIALPEHVRRTLERNEISYMDGQGAIHIAAPGVFIHVGRPNEHIQRREAGTGSAGIGALSVRAVQVILGEPRRGWQVTELARAADISAGQAHRVWQVLQREGMVVTEGIGPNTRRTVREPRELLDWLAAQRPARRVHERLTCALYAATLPRLCGAVTSELESAAVRHAWTGAAAAALQQVGPTAVPRATLRVDPERELTEIATLLGAEQTDRGANLVLWRDVACVGIHQAIRRRAGDADVPLAPPVRVYLDLLGERRGEDLAAQYRETIVGY